jgi:sigma-B regulation protein RsbU (phosphoserine phosphatase)
MGAQVFGVLDVGSRTTARFGPEDEAALSLLAAHLALVIDHERRFAALEDHAQSLAVLHEVSRELTSILDLDTLITRLAALARRVVDYDQLTFHLWREDRARLDGVLTVTWGERRDHRCAFELGHGITGATAALRHPIRVPNVRLDPRFVACDGAIEVASELAAPVLYKDRLLGVIDLESSRPDAFTARHEEMLVTLASCVGVALENARLYAALLEKDRLLTSDLAAAREIQRGLLPAVLPRFPGLDIAAAYEPARALGGDFYDVLVQDPEHLAFAVGDVAGKSTGAALLAALTVGTLREHVVAHRCTPAEMLRDLNDHLERFRVEERFVAMAFGLWDRAAARLTLANAGFPRPHLLRAGAVLEIGVNGMPLALFPGMDYDEDVRELGPGDVVVFASDGIEECLDPAGEPFGVEGLRSLLRRLAGGTAHDLARGIIEATDAHAGGAEPSDDRTVIVMRVTG